MLSNMSPTWFPRWIKPVVFLAALGPAVYLAVAAPFGGFGVNPIEAVIRYLGDTAITMLLIALAVTPVRRLSGWTAVMRLRRMLGLFAFFYAALHVLAYVGLDQFFNWSAIWGDILKRKYITVGMATFVILTALAATSPKFMVRRLGGRAWQRLHKSVYLAGGLAVLHYLWMVKADIRTPLIYGAALVVLLVLRRVPAMAMSMPKGRVRPAGPR